MVGCDSSSMLFQSFKGNTQKQQDQKYPRNFNITMKDGIYVVVFFLSKFQVQFLNCYDLIVQSDITYRATESYNDMSGGPEDLRF